MTSQNGSNGKRDWLVIILEIVGVGILAGGTAWAATATYVTMQMTAHENKPWHEYGGQTMRENERRISAIERLLAVQTEILTRLDRRIENNAQRIGQQP